MGPEGLKLIFFVISFLICRFDQIPSNPQVASLAGLIKGQLISKANFQAVNSSKKQTNEFVFTI